MRTTHILLGMLALSGGLVITAGGCSSDPDPVDPTGSGGTGPGTGGTTTNGGAGGTTTSTGAGGTGDGNDSFDEAIDMDVDTSVTGSINPDDDYDFYKFTGEAGQSLYIFADAKPNTDPFADGYVDTVVELFDESQQRIAMNDDPFPRTTQDSTLITELPAAGTYYLRISDFCTWDVDFGSGQGCGAGYVLDNRSYTLAVVNIDYDEVGNVDESEGGAMEYGTSNGATASGFYAPLVHGTFDDAGDVDTYSFKIPNEWVITNSNGGRPTAYFEIFPAGDTGNGSTAPTGNVWITATASPIGAKEAEIDGSQIDPTFGMSIALPLGAVGATNFSGTLTYYLHVSTSASNVGPNPFYFITHYGGGSNEIETKENENQGFLNDEPANAESPILQTSSTGADAYFVGGNIALGQDVDMFELDLAGINPALMVVGSCAAQRIGSGLENFKMTLLDSDGTTVIATGTESAMSNASLGENVAIPSGATSLYLLVESSGLETGHIGDYYQCGIAFVDPN